MELPIFSHAGFHRNTAEVPFHRHAGSELILVLRGSCTVESVHGRFEGKPGELLVIPPGVSHNQVNTGNEANLYCVFQAETALFPPNWRVIGTEGAPRIRRLMLELWHMTAANDLAGAEGILHSLLCGLRGLEERHSKFTALPPGLRRALAYLHENYRTPINIAVTARAAGVGESSLRALFHTHCHDSPVRYLQKLRLSHAKNLLRDPNCSVAEAARQCGFENPNYFIRLYARFYGCPPGRHRLDFRDTTRTPGPDDPDREF